MEVYQKQLANDIAKVIRGNAQTQHGRDIEPDIGLCMALAVWALKRELSIREDALAKHADRLPKFDQMKHWTVDEWREWGASFGLDLEWDFANARGDSRVARLRVDRIGRRTPRRVYGR